MKSSRWLHTFAIAILALSASMALAQHEDHGHGRGHDKHGDEDEDNDEDRKGNSNSNKDHGYKDHGHGHGYGHGYDVRDHEVMHGWYQSHRGDLPPGLAKKDRLPPGLERQLELRGTLPPGLRGRIYAVPVDLERELPPPPPNCEHVFIGGHVVLLNRSTFVVVDVFHLGF
jgi:Ni/Co efflux regulator RcnB